MANELFKIKAVKIATLGEYLNRIRTQHNLDIPTLSLLTQIKPLFLESLEAGAYDKLPAEVYVRGFLKKLAQTYHIRESVLVEQFEKERPWETKILTRAKIEQAKLSVTPKTVIIAASLAVALIAFGYVGYEIRSLLTPPKLEISQPLSDAKVLGDSIVVAGKTEIGADVTINDQALTVDANGQFTENLLLSSGLNVVEISAKNKFGKVSKVVRKINAEIPQNLAKTGPSPVEITIVIGPASSWIYLEADGVVIQRGTMLPGSAKTVKAQNDVILTSANAGSTQVVYNGKDLGKLGREGEVIRNVEFSVK